jgi:hypothetical protein
MLPMMTEYIAAEQAIPRLVAEAKEVAQRERRSEKRIPFFRNASIHVNGQCYSAYTRNISDSGIGLMHTMELPLCDVELNITADLGRFLKFRARVERCESSGDGLYVSGLMFLQGE